MPKKDTPGTSTVPGLTDTRRSNSSREHKAALAERRRVAFRRFLAERQMRPAELAHIAGLTRGNALYNFINGYSQSLSQEIIERLLSALPGTTLIDLMGPTASKGASGARHRVPITSADLINVSVEARAGFWQSDFLLPPESQTQLPVPKMVCGLGDNLFAVRVAAPGAELLYPDGTILICCPMTARPHELPDGCRVIVCRQQAAGIEVNIREVVHIERQTWLWPRSTHPCHTQPIIAPLPRIASEHESPAEDISIVGFVLASWQPGHIPRSQ